MARRFRCLERNLDLEALRAEIDADRDVWTTERQRQSEVDVQRETESLMLFGHAAAEGFREARQRHPVRYRGAPTPAADRLPATRGFVESLAGRVAGIPGRAVLVRLRPYGRVYEHTDRGLYYQLRSRYHLVVRSPLGSPLRAGPETVRMREGELWWFDNRLPHEAWNESDEPRIHLIVDVLSPGSVAALPVRLARNPRRTIDFVRRKLSRSR